MNYSLIEEYIAIPDNPGVKTRFEAWLSQSPENRVIYERYLKSMRRIKATEPPDIPDSNIIWSKLEDEITSDAGSAETQIEAPAEKTKKFSPYIWQVAAALLIAISGYLILQRGSDSNTIYQTALAETKQFQLPDGSQVEMNVDSELRLGDGFDKNGRRVFLSGQAFFKVKPGRTNFTVETAEGAVTVLGTEFDVNSRYEKTTVIVREGVVRLQNTLADTLRLTANERGVVDARSAGLTEEQVDADYLLGWLDDRFVFHKTPLQQAIDELERHYDVEVKLAQSDLRGLTLSGSYAYRSIDSTLKSFSLALNLRVSEENGHYTLHRK